MSFYIIAYDIGNDRRRRRVAKVLERFGTRIQKSVFEARLEPWQIKQLKRRIGPLLAKADEFDIFPIDEHSSRNRIRWQRLPAGVHGVFLYPTDPDFEFPPHPDDVNRMDAT